MTQRKERLSLSKQSKEELVDKTVEKQKKEENRSIHKGHRERVKQKFLKHSLDVFDEHQILEMLLFYGLPRADTNPIAHELLNRFGSIIDVCDAPLEELIKIKGITQNVAVLLKFIPQFSRYYANRQAETQSRVYDTESAYNLIKPQFIGKKDENVVLILLDSKGRVLYCDVISEGNINTVPLYIRKIITLASAYNAAGAIIAHNHPSGSVMPSPGDIAATKKLFAAFETIDVSLHDHIIYAYPDTFSMKDSGLLEHILPEQYSEIQTNFSYNEQEIHQNEQNHIEEIS